MSHHCDWIGESLKFESRDSIVKNACKLLKTVSDQFTHVAVTGYSSTIIGSIVAHKMKKEVVVVRKENEIRASSYDHEYSSLPNGYVFIDDFIGSGCTLKRVVDKLGPKGLVAIYTYHQPLNRRRVYDKCPISNLFKGMKPIILTPCGTTLVF